MKSAEFKALIDRERKKNNIGDKHKKINNAALDSCLFKLKVSKDNIINLIVPFVVKLESQAKEKINKTELIDSVKKFIDENKLQEFSNPVYKIIDPSPKQRRMDSLARLLSLKDKYTPCVAVTFHDQQIIISSNSPKEISDSQLVDCIATKMGLIQAFLNHFVKNIKPDSEPDIENIKFSSRAKLLALNKVIDITSNENGGAADILPSSKNRKSNRKTISSHLQNALLKLAKHCLLSIYTNGKKGFSVSERNILLNSQSMVVITPNTQTLEKQQLHAEQAILCYLRESPDFEQAELEIYIGISKLCCQACSSVLKENNNIHFRGTHGINFPNVYDINQKQLFVGQVTSLNSEQCPPDSDSDCEFTVEDNDSDSLLTLEDLLSDDCKVINDFKNNLFIPCRQEVEKQNEGKDNFLVLNK